MRAPVVLALMAGLVTAGGALPAQARDNCQKAIHKAEVNLRKEVLRHGQFSPQARYRRHQLDVARQRCGQSMSFRDRDQDGGRDRRDDRRNDGDHR